MATAAIPVVPDGSWPVYNDVERFLLDEHNREGTFEAGYEELGRLVRLVADLRADAGHLETLADDLEKLCDEAIDAVRNADAGKERTNG